MAANTAASSSGTCGAAPSPAVNDTTSTMRTTKVMADRAKPTGREPGDWFLVMINPPQHGMYTKIVYDEYIICIPACQAEVLEFGRAKKCTENL